MFTPKDIVAGLKVTNPHTGMIAIVVEQLFRPGRFILVDAEHWHCTVGDLDNELTAEFFNNEGFLKYEPALN